MTTSSHFRCIRSLSTGCEARQVGSKNGFILNDCRSCRHGYVHDPVTRESLEKYYADSAKYSSTSFADDLAKQRFPGSRSDSLRYLELIRSFSKVARPRLLEVGAGWGYASEAATNMGWQADVIEYSNDCIDSLTRRLPRESKIFQGGFEEFAALDSERYDAILMSQVLEHAINPLEWFALAGSLLKTQGILVVAVPLYKGFYRFMGLRDPFITPPEHLNFFTLHSLKLAALESGLIPLYVQTYSRIPYFNLENKLKARLPSILVYRMMQFFFWVVDLTGLSMIQIQVFKKSCPTHPLEK